MKNKQSIFTKLNSFSDIVQAMVDGLEKEWVRVDMSTFGEKRKVKKFFGLLEKEVCFGCAATNTICELMEKPFKTSEIDLDQRYKVVNHGLTKEQLQQFEFTIDHLRLGFVQTCVNSLDRIEHLFNFTIDEDKINELYYNMPHLPRLDNSNYKEGLPAYQKFADALRKVGL